MYLCLGFVLLQSLRPRLNRKPNLVGEELNTPGVEAAGGLHLPVAPHWSSKAWSNPGLVKTY